MAAGAKPWGRRQAPRRRCRVPGQCLLRSDGMDKPHSTSPLASDKDATTASDVPTGRHRRRDKSRLLPIALILLCAALVRTVYLLETTGVPYMRHLIGDAAAYYDWARTIAGGNWVGQESF